MKVYLDDNRTPYSSEWKIVRNYDEFKKLLEESLEEITEISFDHDLATEHYHKFMSLADHEPYNSLYGSFKEKTGLHCAQLFLNMIAGSDNFPKVNVHSMNPVGSYNIMNFITAYLVGKGLNPHNFVSNHSIPFTTK